MVITFKTTFFLIKKINSVCNIPHLVKKKMQSTNWLRILDHVEHAMLNLFLLFSVVLGTLLCLPFLRESSICIIL